MIRLKYVNKYLTLTAVTARPVVLATAETGLPWITYACHFLRLTP